MDENTGDSAQSASPDSLSYRDAGVDIDAGNALVHNLKGITDRTRRPEVVSGLGGFGGLFEVPSGYKKPVLVSATDGVGTKLKLAMELGLHNTVGIDLVAMCVNDLIVCGAEPLFFLDYYATGKLDVALATEVVAGIGQGCELAGCALIGGETAEMPGMYTGSDYDLAGFAVGIVEKEQIIDNSRVQPGDRLIGLFSSGPHSNGYSLIRKIIERDGSDLSQQFGDTTLGNALLSPTEIYVAAVKALSAKVQINALAHITGGGILENLPRVLPAGTQAQIDPGSWQMPGIFTWMQDKGNVATPEMYRTFNCGLGMIVCVADADYQVALDVLQQHNRGAAVIGRINDATVGAEPVILRS